MSIKLIITLARGLCLGAVFADDVGKLAPPVLRLLDDGLREIGRKLIPHNRAQTSEYHNNQFPGELEYLLNRVGLRKGMPFHGNDLQNRWDLFLDPKSDRNWRLENGLMSCRVWSFLNDTSPTAKPGHLTFETYYQLVKFRGIDLNDPGSL